MRRSLAVALGLAAWIGAVPAAEFAPVAKILAERCVLCHSGPSAPLDLRLDSLEALRAGSRNGPVARPGDPDNSELIRRLRGTSQPRMPMTGPPFLSEAEIATISGWIAAGMPAGEGAPAATAEAPRPAPGETVTYAHVAPIFARRCAKCHTDNGLMGAPPEGYRLSAWASTVSAADRVRVVPGQPLASELLRRIRGLSRPRMPFDGPPWLDDAEVDLIEAWIRDGARDAAGEPAPVPVGARVRFEGQLTGQWTVDGQPLSVSAGTRIDKRPRIGDRVEVRARVAPDGALDVTRLRRR
ncbi:MAG: hypothetical protein KDH20_07130 [Rhodocyclaceae bacterium]|nr:hypothetical protein [Rhodocyclaceae bacterium]